jgi:hypothetical protein
VSKAGSTAVYQTNLDQMKDFIISPKDTARLLQILNTDNVKDFSVNLWQWMQDRFPAMTQDMLYANQKYNGRV